MLLQFTSFHIYVVETYRCFVRENNSLARAYSASSYGSTNDSVTFFNNSSFTVGSMVVICGDGGGSSTIRFDKISSIQLVDGMDD